MSAHYLKGLDTLRALAALIVVWSHIEYLKGFKNLPQITWLNVPNAHFSVTLFFVMSGFLITYLLVLEKDKTDTISFKNFYLKRVLRIWPLYYLILIISYFFLTNSVTLRTGILSVLVAPNISLALKAGWDSSPQIWSIGVEEQFYLFWPLIIYFVKDKFIVKFLIIFILTYTAAPYILNFINIHTIYNEKLHSFTEKFFYYTKFNCMALGGLVGYSFAKNISWIRIFYLRKAIALVIFIIPFILWFGGFTFYQFTEEVYAIFFSLMILTVVKSPFLKIDFKISKFLGKISYGIYMYHWLILMLMLEVIPLSLGSFYQPAIYLSVFGLTILVSWISFITYERYFLNLKNKIN